MPVSDDTARTEPPTPREFTDRVAGFRERPADTAAYGQLVADLQAAGEAGLVAELSALHAAEVSDPAAAASAWATAGEAYRVIGRDERAERAFAAALDLDPGHPQAAPTLATLLTDAGRHAEAAEIIEDELAALTEQPERERGASAREALVARRAERHRALATLWEHHLGRVDRALDHWQRAWHLEPARTDALAAARSIYASLGDDKMVARLYQAELDLLGEQGPAPRRAELELALGRIIARDGDAAQAAEHLERALALAPASDQARELLAEVYSAEAGASAERAERAAELLLELGRRRLATPPSTDPGSADDPEEDGIAFLRRALGLSPGSRAITEALAEALRHAGRWEELDQLYEHFLSGTRDPAARIEILDLRVELHESELDQPEVLRALLSELAQHGPPHGERANRLREFLRQAEDWPALAQHIEAELPALSGDRERTVAEMLELATIVREHLGDRDRAAAILHHILREIDPGNPQVLARYGDHFRERRDWRGLADLLEFAVDSAGQAGAPPAQIVRQLEEIAEISEQRMGDLDRAIHTWRRIQEFEPQSPKPPEAIRRLESRAKMWASLVGVLEQEAQSAQSPRQRADALRRIAQVYRERQVNPRRAIALYEEVLGIFPDDHAVLKALAELYEREGDEPGLAATLRRQLELDARLLAAQSGAPAGAAPEAAGAAPGLGANTGARDWPVAKRVERLTSLRRLATMYERLGDTDGVVFATTGVLDLLPGDRDALERVERTLEDAGDLERLEKTLSYHANAATGPAEKARVLRRLARLASLRGDEVAAMQRWDDLLRTAPNDGEAIEALAELYERHQRWEDMARVLERGLLSGRSRSAGQSGGGRASTRSGHTDSHRRASTQADAVRTGTSELRVGTGLILEPGQRRVQLERYARVVDEQLGDEQRAARAWHEVRELAPASRPALEALTRLYESLGRWRELCEVLAARIPLEQRDDPRAAAGLALRRAQLLEERLGAPGEAIRALEELIGALSPSQLEAHQALRRLYEARGDFAAAVRIAERELYLTSNSDEKIARGLGIGRLCRDQLHDPMRALQAYERVLQLAPDHPEALTAAADLYARVEDWTSYIRTLERLAELAPAGAERCELMTRIAQVTAERVGDHLGAFGWYRRAYEHQPGADTLAALRRAAETYELWGELADVYEAERARYTDDNGEPSDSGSAGLYVAACRELAAIAERRLAAPIRAMNVLLDAIHCWPQDAGLLAEAERIAVEADQRPIWQVLLECQSAALERSSRSRKVSLHSSRARVLEEHLDDPDEAVEEMLMAFAWQPDRAETRQALYDLAERRGAWKDVVAVESALLERAPSVAARIAVLRRKAEIIEERLKDPTRAFRTHLVAFLLQPEDSDTVAHLWRLGRIVGSVYPDADKKPRSEPPPAYVHPSEPALAPPPGTPPVRAQGSRPGVVMPRVDDSDISSEIPIEVEGMLPAVDPTQELSLADLAELRTDDSQGAAEVEENDFAGPENKTILLDLDEIDIEDDDAELGGGRSLRADPTIELSTEDLIHTLRERPDKRNLPPPFLPGVSTGPRPGASRRPPPSPKRAPPPPPRRVKLPPLPAMPVRAYESPWDEFATGYDLLPAPNKVAKMRWLFRAAEVWETGAGDIGRAFNTLARALELGVEDSEPRARLQRLTTEHGTWDRLADLYEAAAEEAKSADAAVGLLIEVAEIRARQGRNRDTEALYRRVLGMLPRDRVARERLEALYRSEGRWVDLAASLEERTDPRFGIAVPESERPAFLRELASMYRDRLGRNHDAIDALLRLRELMPEDVEVLGELAELYGEVGRWSKVIQTLDRVGEIAEGSPEARAALRRIAEIYERELELPDRAIESYTQLVMQWSDDTEAYAALDKLLEGLGRWTDLADILRRRAGLSRDSEQRAQLLRRRAAVLTKHLNAPEEGAAALRHARTLTPNAPGLEDELVHALIAAGRAREAQALLDVRVDALLAARREQVTRRDTERDGAQPPRRAQTEPAVATSGHALSSGGARRSTAAGELGGGDNTGGAGDVAALLIRLADLQAERLDDAAGAKATLAKVLALVPDHPTALARQVSLLESERDPRAFAEARLREAESLDDLDAKVLALMDAGVTLRDRCEDIDGARAAFEAVLAVRPYHPDATWGLAGLASEGGDPSQAAQVLETRLEDASLEPGEAARILTQLAALARQTGVGVAAERRLIEALAADPTHLPAIIARADLLGEGERYEDLEAFLRETLPGLEGAPSETLAELNRRLAVACEHLGDDDEAYQILLAAERLHRGHLLVKLALGENRYRAKRWREAALHLSSLAVHPDASRYPAEVAEGLYHAAQAEIRSLRPEKARPLYERALDLKPNFTPALHALAEQAMAQGEHQRAADFLTRQAEATEEPVERMRLFEALGDMAAATLGDQAKALTCYQSAASAAAPLESQHLPLLEKLLSHQEACGDHRGAARTAELMASFGDDAEARAGRYASAAENYLAAGDRERALAAARSAVEAEPYDLNAVTILSELLVELDAHEELAAALGRALSRPGEVSEYVAPRKALLWDRLARAREARGDVKGAIGAWERAVDVAPNSDGAMSARRALIGAWRDDAERRETSLGYRRMIALDSLALADVVTYARALCRAKHDDGGRAMLELAQVMGHPFNELDRSFLERRPVYELAAGESYRGVLGEAERGTVILERGDDSDDEEQLLGPVLETLWEAAALLWSETAESLLRSGVVDAIRVTPPADIAAVDMFPRITAALDAPATVLYTSRSPEAPDVQVVCAAAPIVVLGPRILALGGEASERLALRFILGRAAEMLRPENLIAAGLPEADFNNLLGALLRLFGPESLRDFLPGEFADEESKAEYDESLRTALPVKLRDRLGALLAGASGRDVDPERFLSRLDRAADRAGLLVCGDIATALANAGSVDSQGRRESRHLFTCALSRDYLAARSTLGVGVR